MACKKADAGPLEVVKGLAKVIHNCLIANRYLWAEQPQRSDLDYGWPREIRERV
jgi:hypothetical protein